MRLSEQPNRIGQVVRRPLVAAGLQSLMVGGTALIGIGVLSVDAQRALLDDLRRRGETPAPGRQRDP